MPFHRPGWSLANGHIVRSNLEAALCDYLSAAVEPHVHATLNFNVPIGPNRFVLYTPSIILTQSLFQERVILIEPVSSAAPGGGARRLAGFRATLGGKYFLIAVARRALPHVLPETAYDLLLPSNDFAPLDEFLRSLT